MCKGGCLVGKKELRKECRGGHKEGTVMNGAEAKAALAAASLNLRGQVLSNTCDDDLKY